MKVQVEIDFSDMFVSDTVLSDLIRDEISNTIRVAVRQAIKKDKRFSMLVKESADLFFNSIKLVKND